MSHMTPSLDVKCPFSEWEPAIDDDEMVDVTHLARGAHVGRVELSVAMTAQLWDRAGMLPFALVGRVTAAQRIRDVVNKAMRALARAHQHFGAAFEEATGLGFAMDFAVGLPTRATDRPYQLARYHFQRRADGRCCMTIGAPSEFSEASQARGEASDFDRDASSADDSAHPPSLLRT